MEELWREVPGFLDYEVNNLGQVRSLKRAIIRVLSPSSDGHYQGVSLRRSGKTYFRRIGRLVLLAFEGPPPDGMEMCHNDGNPTNDHLTNLRWDTHNANMQDASNHGRMMANGKRKSLGQDEVYTIRIGFAFGKSIRVLAGEFMVSTKTVRDVLNGQRAYRGGLGPIRKPKKRLTDQQAVAIRQQRASGKSLINLAQKYGVTPSAISRISSGERHIYV